MSAAHIATFFLHLLQTSELLLRTTTGFVRRHPRRNVVGDLLFEMEAQLGVELLFRGPSAEEALVPAHKASCSARSALCPLPLPARRCLSTPPFGGSRQRH